MQVRSLGREDALENKMTKDYVAHGGSIISSIFNSLSKEVVAWAQEADCGGYSPFLGPLHLLHAPTVIAAY